MIYVFKTSVKTKIQIKKLKPHIDKILPEAIWNFDIDDCDHILRIDNTEDIVSAIIHLLNRHNYECAELE